MDILFRSFSSSGEEAKMEAHHIRTPGEAGTSDADPCSAAVATPMRGLPAMRLCAALFLSLALFCGQQLNLVRNDMIY